MLLLAPSLSRAHAGITGLPALVAGDLASLWVYLAAPVLGALLAVPAHRLVFGGATTPRG